MSVPSSHTQSGNILFYVLIGIVLVGFLTVALRNTNNLKGDTDTENLALKAGQVQRFAGQVENAVKILLQKSVSEADIRFAHPSAPSDYGLITTTPQNQVFSPEGGMATYQAPPSAVNDGSPWEFFGTTDTPQVGSDKADLIAVLPHVTPQFCSVINSQIGYAAGSQPTDSATGTTPDCVMGSTLNRFTGSFSSAPNVLDKTSFTRLPAYQGCVKCDSDSTYNYYYVLLAR